MPAQDHPKEEMLRLYYNTLLTRHFEDRLSKLYRQDKIFGGLCLSTGREAIPAGTCEHLRKDDVISPVHRDPGAFLIKGMEPGMLMAQILGKEAGAD